MHSSESASTRKPCAADCATAPVTANGLANASAIAASKHVPRIFLTNAPSRAKLGRASIRDRRSARLSISVTDCAPLHPTSRLRTRSTEESECSAIWLLSLRAIAVALLQMARHKQREAPVNPGTERGRMPRTGSCGDPAPELHRRKTRTSVSFRARSACRYTRRKRVPAEY